MEGATELGVSLVLLRPLAQSAARLGADADAFLASLGVTRDADVDTFVDGARVVTAIDALAAQLGDPTVGLSLARVSPVGSLGFLDYCAVTSATLREAFARTARFYGLLTQRVALAMDERDGVVHLVQRLRAGVPRARHLADFAFALLVRRAREALGGPFALREVRFMHAAADPAPYRETFQCDVLFEQSADELTFDAAILDAPLRTADPQTAALLEAHARRLHAKLEARDPSVDRVRQAIARDIKDARLERVAAALGMSTRTLQRQLGERKTTFQRVADEVRGEVATALLARPDVSIVEVAYELGFTQAAAFYRAFRRWTGMTPGAYRAAKLGGEA